MLYTILKAVEASAVFIVVFIAGVVLGMLLMFLSLITPISG